MANSTLPILMSGQARDGNAPRLLQMLRDGDMPDVWQPSFGWVCPITYKTLGGVNVTQTSTITVGAAGFVAGRLTVTFSGGGLASPVTVTADASDGDANTDLATALEAAIATARAGDLAGVVSNETVTTNVVTISFVKGIGLVAMTIAYDRAQLIEVQYAGTLADGDYTYRFTGGGLGAAVDVTVPRIGGSPAAITDMIVAAEAAIEAAAGLSAVVATADDDGSDLNSVQIVEALDDVTITPLLVVPQTFTATFGGTETDGNYDLVVEHSSLPGPVTVRVTRAAASPATNADLAAAMETAFEAHGALVNLIDTTASADSGAVYTIVTYPGVTGLEITSAAPSPGTLVVAETTVSLTATDATPAGPSITQSNSALVELNDVAPYGFPARVIREEVMVYVRTAFNKAGRTVTVGDVDGAAQLLGGTPAAIDATGRTGHAASDTKYEHRPEAALAPTATFNLGNDVTLTAGDMEVWIMFAPDAEVVT